MKGLFFLFISFTATSISFSFEGVKNIWVYNDQWVNTKTEVTMANDAVRLAGVTSGNEEAKALAIYYWILRTHFFCSMAYEGKRASENPNYDVWNGFHAYPGGQCNNRGPLFQELWAAYKCGDVSRVNEFSLKVEPWFLQYDPNGHTESAIKWQDNDGVTRYHWFDVHHNLYTYIRNGSRIASPDDIKADYTLLTNPPVKVEPFYIKADYPPDSVNPILANPDNTGSFDYQTRNDINYSPFATNFNLRKGESLRRQWYQDNKGIYDESTMGTGAGYWTTPHSYKYLNGQPKDPRNYHATGAYYDSNNRRTFGNGYHIYTPELENNKYQQGADSYSGLACGSSATGQPSLHPAATGTEGQVVYQIYNIYNYAESFVEGEYYLKSAGTISIDLSTINGSDTASAWQTVWTGTTTAAGKQSFSVNIGIPRWIMNLTTTYNLDGHKRNPYWVFWEGFMGYKYFIRVRVTANSNINDVGLTRLTFKNTVMLNPLALPTLMPGQNKITVEGNDTLPPGTVVRVIYEWEENGATKSQVAADTALPFNFYINVQEPDTLKVKCRYFTVEVADGLPVGAAKSSTDMRGGISDFYAFPNPFYGEVRLEMRNVECGMRNFKFDIYDLCGKLVHSALHTPHSKILTWDGNDIAGHPVPAGLYLARFKDGEKSATVRLLRMR